MKRDTRSYGIGEPAPAAAATPLPPRSPAAEPARAGSDEETLLELVEGDHTLLREISGLFVADAAHRLEELRRAIAAGDERAARRANHTLLGAAGNFGAREVDRSLRRLGRMLRSGALDDPGAASRLRPALVRAERRVARLVERLVRVASTAEPRRG